jgi:hypothetical protein
MKLYKLYSELFKTPFIKEQCDNRVKEGIFINGSLEELRNFIADFIKTDVNKGSTAFPPFFDRCIPYQCNPYFEECFGVESNTENYVGGVGHIMKQIVYNVCSNGKITSSEPEKCENLRNNLNIVIFNVLNISKEANNPPPLPYTDLSSLQFELTRLKSLKLPNYDKVFQNKDNIGPFKIAEEVNETILNEFENRETIKKYNSKIQSEIKKIIEKIKSGYNQIDSLNQLIKYINNINAVSSIGTMEFTDMIAKFGTNKNVCNYITFKENLTKKDDYGETVLNDDLVDKELLLNGLDTELKTKLINISDQQRNLLLSLGKFFNNEKASFNYTIKQKK